MLTKTSTVSVKLVVKDAQEEDQAKPAQREVVGFQILCGEEPIHN